MAVVFLKSNAITTGDAVPQTLTAQKIDGGRLRERVGFVMTNANDSIGSIYRMVRVNSGDRISRLLLSCDAIASGAASIGIYDISSVNNGTVVDNNFFVAAQPISTALNNLDIAHGSADFGLDDVEKPLWQALNLPSDPGKQYDIALILTAALTNQGIIALRVQYVDGN